MRNYEFNPKSKNKYIGSWTETLSHKIDLPFSVESLEVVLSWGKGIDETQYSHQDIANWCDLFHMNIYVDNRDDILNIAKKIAEDVSAQWDMFLSNSYQLEELQKLDFSLVKLPVEWFSNWLIKLKNCRE